MLNLLFQDRVLPENESITADHELGYCHPDTDLVILIISIRFV